MLIKVLGTASIGGVPEWDCSCNNCTKARQNKKLGRKRSSIAITVDGEDYIVIDTGHDLKVQLETEKLIPPINMPGDNCRHSRIDSVLLTHGHADHTVGLAEFCTGKSFQIPVYGPSDLIDFLFGTPEHPNYYRDLGRLAKNYVIPKKLMENQQITLLKEIKIRGFEVTHTKILDNGRRYPSSTFAYEICHNEKRLIYAPDLGKFNYELLKRIDGADILLIDATFWWDNELDKTCGIPVSSYQLGHVPQEETVETLEKIDVGRIIYTHFNHTNPVLDTNQPYVKIVRESNQEIAFDGMDIFL
jgi:pyrroloquinoline quinone biosynthesis protein B